MFKNYIISPDERGLFTTFYTSDLEKNNLKGKIQAIISTKNKASNLPFAPQQNQIFEVSEFDERGELISYREVYEDNTLYLQKDYIYENEKLKEEIVLDEDNNVIETTYFKYNQDGLMVEEYQKNPQIFFTAIYNSEGILDIVEEKSTLQNTDRKFIITRDNNNICTIEIYDDSDFLKKSHYKYDGRDNLIKVESFNSKNECLSTETMEYDKNDNIIKIKRQDTRRSNEYSYLYNYDVNGNWIKSSFASNGKIIVETMREIKYF